MQPVYFECKKFINEIKNEYKLKSTTNKIYFLSAPRSIGKTYSAWKWADTDFMKPSSRCMYMRITDTQLKKPRAEFRAKYKGKYMLQNDVIYNVVQNELENKTTGEITTTYSPDQVVGWFCSLNNYINEKSNEYENCKFIFIDEVIEDSHNIVGIYAKLTNLLTTIMRSKPDVTVIMLANRDTANNDFMVKWAIEPRAESEYYDDVVYRVSKNIFYIELGDKWYIGMGNQKTLFHEFAQFDAAASRQLSGGYAKDFTRMIKNFKKWGANTFTPLFAINFDELKIYFGSFVFNNIKSYFLVTEDEYENLAVPSYALNTLGGLKNSNMLIEKDEILDLVNLLFFKIRNQQIFYNSFDTYNNVKVIVKLFVKFFN